MPMENSMEDICEVGFEEGKVWLPTHVLNEAFEPKENLWPDKQVHRRFHGVDPSSPADKVPWNQQASTKRPTSKIYPRPRFQAGRASGGPGMQAIFLDSSKKSCGTGFFLPRRMGNDFQASKKPACSPVLLPSRVIHALNLNVHALGTQVTPRRALETDPQTGPRDFKIKNNGSTELQSTVATKSCVASVGHCSSPEIFLPKEWTY